MATSNEKPSRWAQNLALVVAMLGIAGSVTVSIVSEYLRRETQTVLLQRDAYETFVSAARDVDDSLFDLTIAIADSVDAVVVYQNEPTEARQVEFVAAREKRQDAFEVCETEWDELVEASDALLLVGSADAIDGRRMVIDRLQAREDSLRELVAQMVTPNVLELVLSDAVKAFKEARSEEAELVAAFHATLNRFLAVAQVDVNASGTG